MVNLVLYAIPFFVLFLVLEARTLAHAHEHDGAAVVGYYWYHRAHHRIRLFWASHVVHHSSRHYGLRARDNAKPTRNKDASPSTRTFTIN